MSKVEMVQMLQINQSSLLAKSCGVSDLRVHSWVAILKQQD